MVKIITKKIPPINVERLRRLGIDEISLVKGQSHRMLLHKADTGTGGHGKK
jgi:hypothetical protein